MVPRPPVARGHFANRLRSAPPGRCRMAMPGAWGGPWPSATRDHSRPSGPGPASRAPRRRDGAAVRHRTPRPRRGRHHDHRSRRDRQRGERRPRGWRRGRRGDPPGGRPGDHGRAALAALIRDPCRDRRCDGRGGDHGEPVQLAGAYRSALSIAAELGARTLTLPAISAGAYGYPLDDAARIAVATVADSLRAGAPLEWVTFVLFSPRALAAFEHALAAFR